MKNILTSCYQCYLTKVVSLNPTQAWCTRYNIMRKFVSDLLVSGFLRVLNKIDCNNYICINGLYLSQYKKCIYLQSITLTHLSPGTLLSSINKTYHHKITKILLYVATSKTQTYPHCTPKKKKVSHNFTL